MSWFTSISLRVFLATVVGFATTLLLGSLVADIGNAGSIVLPPLLILLPTLFAFLLVFFLPAWILKARWEQRWLPQSQGVREVPEGQRRSSINTGLRELTGVWSFPPTARERTRLFVSGWAKTLLRLRARDDWAWKLYSIAWYALKSDEDAVDELRALLMESRALEDDAFDLGLHLLNVRQADVDLAILLSQEGMVRETQQYDPERRVLLENAWLAAYARDEASRGELLNHLMKLFLRQHRRDEVSGRIYLDAFIGGIRIPELRREMRLVADVLARTGRSPEMTANLRALAGSGNGKAVEEEPDTEVTESVIRQGVASVSYRSAFPEDVDLSRETPKLPKNLKGSRKTKASTATAPIAKGESAKGKQQQKRDRMRPNPLLGRVVVSVLILAGIFGAAFTWFSIHNDSYVVDEPVMNKQEMATTPQERGEVVSELPYTLQVAALPTRHDAIDAIEALREARLNPYYVITRRGDTRWFRVRFGHFSTTRAAQATADSLKALGVIDEYFVATFEPGVVPANR